MQGKDEKKEIKT